MPPKPRPKGNLPINLLEDFIFCEYKAHLLIEEGLEIPREGSVIEGWETHEILDETYFAHAKPMSLVEILELSFREPVRSRQFHVESHRLHLVGCVDEVWFRPAEIVIIEDKPQTKAYLSYRVQLAAYCLSLAEKLSEIDDRPLKQGLRAPKFSNTLFWQSPYTDTHKDMVETQVKRLRDCLTGQTQWLISNNPRKCANCNLNTNCDKKMNR